MFLATTPQQPYEGIFHPIRIFPAFFRFCVGNPYFPALHGIPCVRKIGPQHTVLRLKPQHIDGGMVRLVEHEAVGNAPLVVFWEIFQRHQEVGQNPQFDSTIAKYSILVGSLASAVKFFTIQPGNDSTAYAVSLLEVFGFAQPGKQSFPCGPIPAIWAKKGIARIWSRGQGAARFVRMIEPGLHFGGVYAIRREIRSAGWARRIDTQLSVLGSNHGQKLLRRDRSSLKNGLLSHDAPLNPQSEPSLPKSITEYASRQLHLRIHDRMGVWAYGRMGIALHGSASSARRRLLWGGSP